LDNGTDHCTLPGTLSATCQQIEGPGGVSLAVVTPPPGDGISSAKAKGSGGGFFTLGSNSATVTSTPTVSAYVGDSAFISVTGDVRIASTSTTSMTAYAKNGSGGLIAKGGATATVNQTDNRSTAYVGSSARIVAGGNFELSAKTSSNGTSDGEAKAAGGIGLADGRGTTTLNYETTASIHSNADVLAGG